MAPSKKLERVHKKQKGINYENRPKCEHCGHYLNRGPQTRIRQSEARKAWWRRKREAEAEMKAELERAREMTARLAEEQEAKQKIEDDKMLLFL